MEIDFNTCRPRKNRYQLCVMNMECTKHFAPQYIDTMVDLTTKMRGLNA